MLTMRYQRIKSIIQQRKPLYERVSGVRERLGQALDQFERFQSLCRSTIKNNELATEFSDLERILDESVGPMRDGLSLKDDLTLIQNRLSRDSLNIAVIGIARQGKSRLLQTITGLTTEEIPDGNQAFCTGVRSDIINDPSAEKAYAQVNFLTEKRFIDENIAPYFRDLQNHKPELFTPMSISEFRNFDLPVPGSFQASPEAVPQMNLHLQHLRDLQEHLSQYQDYLGRSPLRINSEDIREYVAQDNKQGERVFFKHMAVDSVEIFCRFPNTDVGALRLIDLPGLGDTRKGDVERVVKALSDQVDLVFFLSKPSNAGAGWGKNEIHLYGKARSALGEKLPIERWAFWVFNHDSRQGADNQVQCDTLKNLMKDAQIQVSGTVTVDCTNQEEVSSKLIDTALDFLANNLERNDREYADKLQKNVNEVTGILRGLLERAQGSLKEDNNSNLDVRTFNNLFSPLWRSIKRGIQACVGEDSELRLKKDKPCEPLKERINQIFTDAEDGSSFMITEEMIKSKRDEEGGLTFAYGSCLHQLRTFLSSKMQENMDDILDKVLTEMKDEVSNILGKKGRLENRFGSSDHLLLGRMIQYINENGRDNFPTILHGLELLDGWKMSYQTFAQHRIRAALACLDPMDEINKSQGNPTNIDQALDLLQDLYEQAVYELRKRFDGPTGIYPEPNAAAFAAAEEFKDIMIRSGGVEVELENEWRDFYWLIRGDVWPDEYGSSQRVRDASSKMSVALNTTIPLFAPTNFDFLG